MPFGQEVKYDSDFDLLKNEIGKPGAIDYDLVEATAIKITKEKSKDLRVLLFLSLSLLRNEKWEEYSDLFEGLSELLEKNYDLLWPDRDRGKQLAFKWLAESRYNDFLSQKTPGSHNYEAIVKLKSALEKIKPVLESKFPDGSPFPSNVFGAVQAWERTCKPKVEPPPSPPAAKPDQSKPENTVLQSIPVVNQPQASTPAVSSSATFANDPMETPKQAQMVVRKAALMMIDKEPDKSMGYRLLRTTRWDLLDKIPPNDNGKTQLPGPNPQQRTFFQAQLNQKNWKLILEKGEAAFASGANHLWLDLQRLAAVACAELGYTEVHQAILIETALLLKRVPGLLNLLFTEGTPFCEDITKDWILQDVNKVLSAGKSEAQSGEGADQILKEQQEINALVAAGKIEDALEKAQNGIRNSVDERDCFRRMTMVGSLLMKAKQPELAISVLDGLDQRVSDFRIDTWEPDLAVEAWSVLVQAIKAAKNAKPQVPQPALNEKQSLIINKISRIDPRKAFMLNKQ